MIKINLSRHTVANDLGKPLDRWIQRASFIVRNQPWSHRQSERHEFKHWRNPLR
jgi:hypothetical protein